MGAEAKSEILVVTKWRLGGNRVEFYTEIRVKINKMGD